MKIMKKGFTLLEILVVIGIIAVLVGIGSTSYSTAQKKARDAKRRGDLKAIQNCVEQYYAYNNNFTYPFTANGNISGTISCGASSLTAPSDPKTGNWYVGSNITTTTYTITADLESAGSGATFTVSELQ